MPQPASSAGWPASTNGRKKSISGPSRLFSAHQRATSPWCQVSAAIGVQRQAQVELRGQLVVAELLVQAAHRFVGRVRRA